LLFGRHQSHTGRKYAYFSCANRTTRGRSALNCPTGYYAVDLVEQGVEDLYATLELPQPVLEIVRRAVTEDIAGRRAGAAAEADRHERRIVSIEDKQEKLVELAFRDLVSEEVMRRQQDRLKKERTAADQALRMATLTVERIEARLEAMLELTVEPHRTYLAGTPAERRSLNRAIFERIEVGLDGEIVDAVLKPAFQALRAWHPGLGRPEGPGPGDFSSARVRSASLSVHRARRSPRLGGLRGASGTIALMPTQAQVDFFVRWSEAARREDRAVDASLSMEQRLDEAARLSVLASELRDAAPQSPGADVRPA
jgi:hypothetical protein